MARGKQLRACLVCSYTQDRDDFIKAGCPNCEDIVEMRGQAERVDECTSANFDGMIAVIKPDESWVARWQRIEKRQPGLYAVRVIGRPPEDVIEAIEQRNGVFRSRDMEDDS